MLFLEVLSPAWTFVELIAISIEALKRRDIAPKRNCSVVTGLR
jgi:hypothetical protein